MFTGLVETVGRVRERAGLEDGSGGVRLGIAHDLGQLPLGASVSVQGACLTVVASTAEAFDAELSPETLRLTTHGELELGSLVNLERALSVGDRLGGHLVTGHVDGVGVVEQVVPEGDMTRVEVRAPEALARFIAAKGSITMAGVSLTVNEVRGSVFSVQLIPHTRSVTTLGSLAAGSRINLEVDLIARYLARLIEMRG